MANPCPCLQPVTETVYKEVPVTKFRAVERTVQKPVIRTAYEEREVTAYRQVTETRTAEVPGVAYQQCTTCQQVTQNRSFWRTNLAADGEDVPLPVRPQPHVHGRHEPHELLDADGPDAQLHPPPRVRAEHRRLQRAGDADCRRPHDANSRLQRRQAGT